MCECPSLRDRDRGRETPFWGTSVSRVTAVRGSDRAGGGHTGGRPGRAHFRGCLQLPSKRTQPPERVP